MLLEVPNLLTAAQVSRFQQALERARWVDGRVTAGHQSARVKNNRQLAEGDSTARKLGQEIVTALERNALFVSAALPSKIFPPLFNRYEAGEAFGNHIDNAIRQLAGTSQRVRTDLAATLFLAPPETYDGGELVIEDTFGVHVVKLPAGHLVLYPASSLHHVRPVTRGARIASFFWIQSMVRDDGQRTVLFDLDFSIQRITRDMPGHESLVQLTGVYHNLLRRWADV
jgi:PKHD-type hydroxylase